MPVRFTDTMLDRTDFESWQQRIRLYCLGKDNGENIMKSITEGPFQMGTFIQTPAEDAEETEGALQLDIYTLINHYTDGQDIWGQYEDDLRRISDRYNEKFKEDHFQRPMQEEFVLGMLEVRTRWQCEALFHAKPVYMLTTAKESAHTQNAITKLLRFSLLQRQDALMNAYENGAIRMKEQLFVSSGEHVTNFDDDVFEADQCDAFDSDYVEDNEEHVVQSNVSSVRNDALMSILDEMHEQGVQSRSANKQVKVVNDTLTSELARYKELVGVYEQRAKFELTDRERKIDEQMRIIISDRNRKETSLKSELHSAQLQLRSTLNHHKIVREEAIILKKDFKQKEDKFLEEFLDIKRLKEKVEDRLYKQDQSVQTVHMICKPKSFYDEKNKVAIGYKNPLCLTRAKQVQPALYNGHVLVMSNHARPVVHDSEDTRDMAEITRKRMMEKMQSPQCVENKVRIAPPDYSKENLLATFAPQRNLTPEQIFWSIDNNDRKKAETSVPKPLSALTVYPPNTPVKLVPRVLPTKSQVKINLYVLTQLFTEFDKTCKKRITPTGVTEGERGFEQTKRCYLTEVIPFFKTLKEHFAGVQTALFKEVKVMEEIFDQMSDEVDQNVVDKQCAEIVKKNLLIENENLIANCLSNQLLFDVEKSRCLDLEAEMSKVHNESKHISKLEREYLNLQLKYQHLQESFDNKKSQASQEAPDFNSFFKIKNLEHQIQEKDNVIRDLKVLVSNVNDRSCEPYNANDVTDLLEQNERLRAEIEKVKQHYKEMFESIKITRTSTNEQTSSLLTQIEDLKAQLEGNLKVATRSSVKTKVLAPGMYAIDVEPIPPRLKNNRNAHLTYINHLKESVETVREIVEEARVVKPLDNALNYACQYTKLSQELIEYVIGTCPKEFTERDSKAPSIPLTRKKQVTFTDTCSTSTNNTQKHGVHQKTQPSNVQVIPSTGVIWSDRSSFLVNRDSGYSKHMTGNRSKLKNFVEKFTVINSRMSSSELYGQFCDFDLEVAFRKHYCFVRDINGADLLKCSHRTNLYTISIDDMMKSSPICLLSKASKSKSWLKARKRRSEQPRTGSSNDGTGNLLGFCMSPQSSLELKLGMLLKHSGSEGKDELNLMIQVGSNSDQSHVVCWTNSAAIDDVFPWLLIYTSRYTESEALLRKCHLGESTELIQKLSSLKILRIHEFGSR
ncbi:hypothetical protein Tco_1174701 [Tanacetum coccineum]